MEDMDLCQILSQSWSPALHCVVCKVVYPFEKVSVSPDKQRVMCGTLNGWQKVSAKHLVAFWMGWFIASRGSSAPPVLHFNLVRLELLVHLQSFDKITMWLCESLPAQHCCRAQINTASSTKIETWQRQE